MKSIELYGRGDRLGANITTMISQIICAVKNKYYVVYNRNFINHNDDVCHVPYNQTYSTTVFIESLFDFIDDHNKQCDPHGERIRIDTIHFFTMISSVLQCVKLDLITYFKQNIYERLEPHFKKNAISRNYYAKIPFDPSKTIAVHLRLNDTRDYSDYDGSICANHFRNVIDNDQIANNNTHFEAIRLGGTNFQAPLSNHKILTQIKIAQQKYPDHKVVLITSPGENTSNLPYECIQSSDESFDLFLLCNANVLILSRSTFAISSLFFGNPTEVYLPLWGHLPCFGLYTKFDHCKINYFI